MLVPDISFSLSEVYMIPMFFFMFSMPFRLSLFLMIEIHRMGNSKN